MERRVVFLIAVLIAATGGVGRGQGAWPFELRWEHDGANVSHFEVCVDNSCAFAPAQRVGSSTWSAAVPSMAQGEHRLVVRACNGSACASGRPDVFVRVVPVPTGPSQGVPAPPSKAKPRSAVDGR